MKKVILLVVLMPCMAYGQIYQDFESGGLINWEQSSDGRWNADTANSITGRFSLHHSYDNQDAGYDRIGIPVFDLCPSYGTTSWSFLVRHGYDPSSSNNWAVFLLSDTGPEGMSADRGTYGFALGVNLTGYDDTLRLWKVKDGALTVVVNSHLNWQSVIGSADPARIMVERSKEGDWSVSVYRLDEYLLATSNGKDNELFGPGWFGICYRYSSTRDRLLWLDDIRIDGIFKEDNEAPEVAGFKVSGMNSIDITLSKPPASGFIEPGNFSLNLTENRPISVKKINGLTFNVKFADMFNNRQINFLIINRICDNSGNCSQEVRVQFIPAWAGPGDVIITEIMADPFPEVSLPGKEYLEITNRTEYSFNMKNWRLETPDQIYLFPESVIKPQELVIICSSKDTSFFTIYGKVTGLEQFPSLTDGGKMLCLSDSSGGLLHGVEYSSDWYKNELKSRGGWSLEMIDTGFPFYYEENWMASDSRTGGTPGSVNSVAGNKPDISFYGLRNVFPDDNLNINVRFSEPVFNLLDDINNIKIDGKEITALYPNDPLYREFCIKAGKPLEIRKSYEINVSGDVEDFAGNKIQTAAFIFGMPEQPEPGDILFNELLFNPFPGDPDYLELYNCSVKVFDGSRLQLVSINNDTGDTSHLCPVSDERRCIMPYSYYAISTDIEKISARYFSTDPGCLFETGSLPSMPDDEGHLVLFNMELDRIDEVIYNDDMHFSLLSGDEGVALEKTGTDIRSEIASNWHSASESSGWGTPGARNSMYMDIPASGDKVVFSSHKITPDNDGYEDILIIRFNLSGNGNVVSVTVFDEQGSYVKKVVSNLFAGPEATVIWDGTADDGSPVNTGIYIVFITLYDDTGKTERWKKICTVLR
jgi:hypothetical protein